MSKKEIAFLKNLGVTIKKVTQTAKEIALFARPDMGLRYQLMKRSSKKQVEFAKNEYKIAEAERDFIENKIVDIAKTRNPKYHLTKQKVHDMLKERDLVNWEIYRADKKTEAGKLRAQTLVKRITKINQELARSMGFYDAAIITDKLGKINIPMIEEKAELVDTIVQIAKERNPERNLTKQEVEQKLIEQDKILSKMNEANEKAFIARQRAKKLTGQKKKEAENIAKQNAIQSKICLNKSNGVNKFLITAMALPDGANATDKSGKINVKAIVLAAAGLAAAGGVAYYVMKSKIGKEITGKQDPIIIDYSDDNTTVTPEKVIIPEGMDPSKNPEAQNIVNNSQTALNNLASSTKSEIANIYTTADVWGKEHAQMENSLPFANLQSSGEYYRGIDENGKFTESVLPFLLRGKNITESKIEPLENQYNQKMQELCPELNGIFQKHGLTLTPDSYQQAKAYDGYWCWDYDGAREDWVFTKPLPDGYSQEFFKEFYFYEDNTEIINFYNQTTDLSIQISNAKGENQWFNDAINTYLQNCSESDKQTVNSFIEQIDASQLEYNMRVAEIQAQTQQELSALDWSNSNNVLANQVLGANMGSKSENADYVQSDAANDLQDGQSVFDAIGDAMNSVADTISDNPGIVALATAGVAVGAIAGAKIVNKIKAKNEKSPKSKEANSIVKRISNKFHKQKVSTQTIETKTNSNDKQMGL